MGQDLITSWNKHGWIDLPAKLGAKIARLIGAKPHEGIGLRFNLAERIQAARRGSRPQSGADNPFDHGNFPTDLYMAQASPR